MIALALAKAKEKAGAIMPYANKILASWFEENLTTVADVEKQNEVKEYETDRLYNTWRGCFGGNAYHRQPRQTEKSGQKRLRLRLFVMSVGRGLSQRANHKRGKRK